MKPFEFVHLILIAALSTPFQADAEVFPPTTVLIGNITDGATVSSTFTVSGTATEANYIKVSLYDSDGVLVTWGYSYINAQGLWSTQIAAGEAGNGYYVEAEAYKAGMVEDSDAKSNITITP